jgi:hypothetical protein
MKNSFESPVAMWRLPCCVLGIAMATFTAEAVEPPPLESVRKHIQESWATVRNLHIRLRQETVLHREAKALSAWPFQPRCPSYCGSEDILFAFDGEKRYRRVLGLDCQPLGLAASEGSAEGRPSQPHDLARVWNETTLRERTKEPQGRFQHHVVPQSEVTNSFPPPQYLMNVGLAVPDPTASREAQGDLAEKWFLPKVLEDSSFSLAKEAEEIDGCRCLVVQSRNREGQEDAESCHDKLWLDTEHGFALRKRELQVGDRRVRVGNDDLTEVCPGLWLPRRSRIEYLAARHVSKQDQAGLVLTQTTKLACCVANQVPPDLFDVVLTKYSPPPRSLFDSVSAYHWLKHSHYQDSVDEVWAVQGRGRRMEVRRDSKLLLLRIDTAEWSLIWRPALNRATLLPSQLAAQLREDSVWTIRRKSALRHEELTALFRCQEGQLDGKKVNELTAYFPTNPVTAGKWPIHQFDPRQQAKLPGTACRTRENWFDPANHLSVYRRCGCRTSKWERTVDFPTPESIRKDLFRFELPEGAHLSAANEELRRLFAAIHENPTSALENEKKTER